MAKTKKSDKPEGAVEVVVFDAENQVVSATHIYENKLSNDKIPFSQLGTPAGYQTMLVFNYTDGTKLKFDMPLAMEADATVSFAFVSVGPDLENVTFSGMTAERHILESHCAGWFRLKTTKEPTVGMMFKSTGSTPFLNFEIERKELDVGAKEPEEPQEKQG